MDNPPNKKKPKPRKPKPYTAGLSLKQFEALDPNKMYIIQTPGNKQACEDLKARLSANCPKDPADG